MTADILCDPANNLTCSPSNISITHTAHAVQELQAQLEEATELKSALCAQLSELLARHDHDEANSMNLIFGGEQRSLAERLHSPRNAAVLASPGGNAFLEFSESDSASYGELTPGSGSMRFDLSPSSSSGGYVAGEFIVCMYHDNIWCESCSQFDSLPLTSLWPRRDHPSLAAYVADGEPIPPGAAAQSGSGHRRKLRERRSSFSDRFTNLAARIAENLTNMAEGAIEPHISSAEGGADSDPHGTHMPERF